MDLFSTYAKNTQMSEPRKYLVYTTERHGFLSRNSSYVGGFADRIKGIITAYLISIKLNRVFVIDWPRPWQLQPILKPSSYNWSIEERRSQISKHRSILHIDVIDDISSIIDLDIKYLNRAIFLDADVVFLNANSFSWDYATRIFPGETAQALFHEAYKSLFSFTMPEFLHNLSRKIEEERAAKASLIGIHLRTGDGNGWADPSLSSWSDFEPFILSAIELAEKAGYKNPAIYFASDSQRAKDAAERRFGDIGLFVSRHEIGHIERSESHSRDAFDYAIAEFHVLAACDIIIGRAGGYYGTAALVGGKPCYKA